MINMHDGKTLCTLLPSYNVRVYSTKPPEIPSEMAGYFVYKGFMPFDICVLIIYHIKILLICLIIDINLLF